MAPTTASTTNPLKRVGEIVFPLHQLRVIRPKNAAGKNVRMTVEEVVAAYPGVKALMAAPMFGHTGTGPCSPGGLTPCTRQLDTVTGVDFPSCRKRSGLTFAVFGNDRRPGIEGLDVVRPGATLGLQCYPTLVWGGVNKGRRERVSSVAGLGVRQRPDQSFEFVYLVAGGGTLRDLGDLFLEKGCRYAGYCDAGSSAALWVVGEGWRGIHARNPKLPSWLAVMP